MKNAVRLIIFGTTVSLVALFVYSFSFLDNYESSMASTSTNQTYEDFTAEVNKKHNEPINIIFVGDIMLDRFVELNMQENGEDYPFASSTELFTFADAVAANLEGPIKDIRKRAGAGSMSFSFATSVAPLLFKHGVTHVSLANNHTNDQGRKYFDFTKEILRENGIVSFGDPTLVGTTSVHREVIKNQEFAFLGLNETYGRLNLASSTEIISNLKKQNPDIFVAVFIHWGEEYKLIHNQNQEKIAHTLIDSGADVIVGHHPHVVQDIEKYNGKIIFYSLGNYIFDQYFSDDTKSQLAIRAKVFPDKVVYEIIPMWAPKSSPSEMIGERKESFVRELFKRSSPELATEILIGKIETIR